MATKKNPRYQNGNLRRKHRARFKAMDAPCGICGGRLGPIHYDEPSDAQHPLSFVIDEIKPISKWELFGYSSARAAAEDWDNLQASHYCCNQQKGARTMDELRAKKVTQKVETSTDW
jgi:5-methylcytosine-specific restriction endonuclease McrA